MITVIRCPLCNSEVEKDFFFSHMDIEHDVKEDSLENFNRRMWRMGVDPVGPYEKDPTKEVKKNLVI